jgi:Flp pilus assembly protein TadG
MPSRLEDRGAVAVEFAVIFPVLLLMLAGIFGLGVVMIQDLQLTFVVQGAAKVEAAQANTGVAWAHSQLDAPASFKAANPTPCGAVPGAQITGTWPISLGIFPSLTLSAQYCWPL